MFISATGFDLLINLQHPLKSVVIYMQQQGLAFVSSTLVTPLTTTVDQVSIFSWICQFS